MLTALSVLLASVVQPVGPVVTVAPADSETIVVNGRVEEARGRRAAEERARQRAKTPTAGVAKPVAMIMNVELRLDPATGGRCAYLFEVPGDPNGAQALENEILSMRLIANYGRCGRSPARPPARPSPGAVAVQVWRDQVTLPGPEPRIAPGWAITGRPAYLEVGGSETAGGTFSVFGYPVEITARPVALDVDWGDGTVERSLRGRPGPWPEGGVRHTYIHARPVTVTVTRRWAAQWRIGTTGGTITEPLATTSTLPLDVREIQAVRNR